MNPDDQLADIARTIQLAVAPVFLLTALGTIIGVLTTRLGRVVDRARVLAAELESASPPTSSKHSLPPRVELAVLARRRRLVNRAITAATFASLLVCLVIAFAFLGFMLNRNFSNVIALLFIGAVSMFIAALLFFLREIIVTVASVRIEDN